MKILVYGAGPLGSLFAAKLKQGGHDVSLLARGKRLQDLKKHGVVLQSWSTGEVSTTEVKIADAFKPNDAYDLVLVIMRKNHALAILSLLAANQQVETFAFLMNNATGPQAFVDALGKDRVLIGFPGAAGFREGHKVVYLTATEDRPTHVYIGEVDGGVTERTHRIAAALEQAPHFKVVIEKHMDTWSKYHVALLFPAFAPIMYLCNTDNYRMANTRDAIVLAVRGIREGFTVLQKLGYKVRPSMLRIFQLFPEPFLVWILKKALNNPNMEIAMVKHAKAAESEVVHLMGEFMQLVRKSGVFTPIIQFLNKQYKDKAPLLPEGSASIKLNWSEVIIPLLLVLLVVMIFVTILN